MPARPGAGRLLGRPAVAAGVERAAAAPLVRDAGPAGRAHRLHGRQRAVPVPASDAYPGRFPGMGLALSLLRGLRHQRGGAVRAAAAGGDRGIYAAARRGRTRTHRHRRDRARPGLQPVPGRLRGPGQLRAVSSGDGVPAVVDRGQRHAADIRCADRADRGRGRGHPGHDGLRLDRRPHRPAYHAGPVRRGHRRVRAGFALAAGRRSEVAGRLHPDRFRAAGPVLWAGLGHGHGELLAPLPLHRRGADVRHGLAVRRGLRAAGRAGLSARFGLVAVSVYLLSGVACTLALRVNKALEDTRD